VSDEPISQAVTSALAGGLVVFPTDTVYGIGTRPDDEEATARLFEVKRRPRHLEIPVLCASFEQAGSIARMDPRAERLARAVWPGPVTIVLPRSGVSAPWQLGGHEDTVGVRVPDHRLALELLTRAGPLAATSANLSGGPTPATCDELVRTFGDAVDVYVCEQRPVTGSPSTVVDLSGDQPRVLRSGALDPDELVRLVEATR
jgi:L-threonylcarbamoyladenylate synthase